jgi:hypothetical protein
MKYLIVNAGIPEPYGNFVWSPKIEDATQFSSLEDANAGKLYVTDATRVILVHGKWYVTKDST